MSQDGRPSTLLLTIAFNGYDWRYRRCIRSQRTYARRHGYRYLVVKHAPFNPRAHEAAWLKLALLRVALDAGYERVAFIDGDCEVRPHTPALESLEQPGRFFYAAPGISGRINSGVMFVRTCPGARAVLDRMLATAEQPVPEADAAPYENGHVIHVMKDHPGLGLLDRRWNNTTDERLDDYIRHYCGGEGLRRTYRPDVIERLGIFVGRLRRWINDRLGRTRFHHGPLPACLEALVHACQQRYPQLSRAAGEPAGAAAAPWSYPCVASR